MYVYTVDFETDCGASAFTNELIREGLQKVHPGNKDTEGMDFGAVSTRFISPC